MATEIIPNALENPGRMSALSYVRLDSTEVPPISTTIIESTQNPSVTSIKVDERYAVMTYQMNVATVSGNFQLDNSGIETRLDDIITLGASKVKQDEQKTLLSILTAQGATPVTFSLTGASTEESLQIAITKLDAISSIDYSTESTLSRVASASERALTQTQNVSSVNNITGYATESKQDTSITLLNSLTSEDYSTESTLNNVLTAVRDNKIADPATNSSVQSVVTQTTNISNKLSNPLTVNTTSGSTSAIELKLDTLSAEIDGLHEVINRKSAELTSISSVTTNTTASGINVSNYIWHSFDVSVSGAVNATSATFRIEASNDGVNWKPLTDFPVGSAQNTTGLLYSDDWCFCYSRASIINYSSGTYTVKEFHRSC